MSSCHSKIKIVKIAKALELTDAEFAELCGYRKDDENEKNI